VNEERTILVQSVLAAVNTFPKYLAMRSCSGDGTTLKALVVAWNMFNDSRGKASYTMRAVAKGMDASDVDRFAESLPEYEKQVRDILAGGILEKLGTWRVWCWIRKFSIGKKPEEAEAEMEREHEIEIIKVKLVWSWNLRIGLNTGVQRIIDKENELMDQLHQIDETADQWIKENMPDWRKGAKA